MRLSGEIGSTQKINTVTPQGGLFQSGLGVLQNGANQLGKNGGLMGLLGAYFGGTNAMLNALDYYGIKDIDVHIGCSDIFREYFEYNLFIINQQKFENIYTKKDRYKTLTTFSSCSISHKWLEPAT